MGKARVVTTCFSGRHFDTVEENRRYALKLVDEALRLNPDIICLPEAFTSVGVSYTRAEDVAEELDGPTVREFSRKAIEGNCYIICPILTKREGNVMNSAIVLDRDGDIVGIYDKVHPVTSSPDYTVFEGGVTPGKDFPVFDLDFGRIGIQICFDICFPEGWFQLKLKGAKIVFWVSAYNGGFPLRAYACINNYYVVTSVRTEKAMIIDPCGRVVAQTDHWVNMILYDLNTDFIICHYDFNYSIPDLIVSKYRDEVRIRSYGDDSLFVVEPLDDSIKTKELQVEFGFESLQQYVERHQVAHEYIRRGEPPQPQKALHGTRPQYRKWI